MAVWIALGAVFMGIATMFISIYAARKAGKGKGE
jgi:hypothetical protein